ncbi:MAG: FkbM family methyltransferase, partial [Atribacterota bacterium]
GDTVIDLGANVGIFTMLACKIAKKVIAVEAQSEFIPIIKSNISKLNCANEVDVEFGILGNDKGSFSDNKKLISASHYKNEPPSITIQYLINKYNLNKIDFLKCDIEGSEFSIFDEKEDLNWLKKVKYISMEVHKEHGDPNNLCDTLIKSGYDVKLANKSKKEVKDLKSLYGFIYAKNKNIE